MSTRNKCNSKNIIIEIDNNFLNKSFLTKKRNINHKKCRENFDGLNKGNRLNKNEFNEIIDNYKEEINYFLSEKKNNEINKTSFITDLSIIQSKLINNVKKKIYSPLQNIKIIEKESSIFYKREDKKKIKEIKKNTILKKNDVNLFENSIYHELFELIKINMKNCNLMNLCNEIIMKTCNHKDKNNLLNLNKININNENLIINKITLKQKDKIKNLITNLILERENNLNGENILFNKILNDKKVQKIAKKKLKKMFSCFNIFQKQNLTEKIYSHLLIQYYNNNKSKNIEIINNYKSEEFRNKFFIAFRILYYLFKFNHNNEIKSMSFWKDIYMYNFQNNNCSKNIYSIKDNKLINIKDNNYPNNYLKNINNKDNNNYKKKNYKHKIIKKNSSKKILFTIIKHSKENSKIENNKKETETETETEDDNDDENNIDINYFLK